jgi:hypothetical protein
MSHLKSTFIIILIFSLAACTKNNSPKPAPAKPDIYLTGYAGYGNTIFGSVYWKNGVLIPLTGGQFATGIDFIDTNVYVVGNAGYQMPSGGGTATEAVYWKNGVMVKLGNPPSYASAIVISGTDIYIAGMAEVNNVYCAVYWKNGVLDTLTTSPYSVANAIAVSGSDMYIAGNTGSTGHDAVYWKNGVQIPLENSSEANAIAVSGTDVYVAGFEYTAQSIKAAVYWKNGVRVNLNSALIDTSITNTYASSIAVSGNDVHVTGYMGQAQGVYWKNGIQESVNNANFTNMTFNVNGIVLSGSDVYISLNTCAYWKNDSVINVGNGYATNIAVRP